ncbi:MAG TPA: HdeD family acid-resistance protein [Steroidobacteraceae bacterium]|jgi:uncharacterized membrane protein HdeD (DUF308 family)|nr:HdeD family acid-resistance protein [Steroidobacteraceae bacterium]
MATNPLDLETAQAAVAASLKRHWRTFLIEGIILVVLGMLAIIVPPIATLAVEVLIGWLLLVSGVVGLISTFRMRHAPGFGWSLLSALVGIAAGVILLAWPVSGAVSLTLVLSVFLLVEGIASIMIALHHRREFSGRWAMLLFSGIVDIVLAAIIFLGLPGTAAWAIGLLVGINLVVGGSALISMALHARAAVLPPQGQG